MLPKPTEKMLPEEQARADDMYLRCLTPVIRMFERVNGVRVFIMPIKMILAHSEPADL